MSASAEDTYDVVVVGGGLGGLSAGACLARAGKRVLLVERQDGPGGNAHAFTRGPYTFDPAIHVTAHGFHVEFLGFYLSALGVQDRVDLMMVEPYHAIDIDGARFTVPVGVEAVKEYLAEQFPADADGVRRYIDTAAEVTRESQQPPPRVDVGALEELMKALPMLFRYRTATLADVLDEFLTTDEAKAVCGAQWPYLGLPPSQLSYMAASGAWMALMEPGPVYVRGSFQKLADALALAIRDSGGDVVLNTSVTGITVEGGAVRGVTLEGGRRVGAQAVVSNADAVQTFETLVGHEHLPERFLRRLARMTPSTSAFLLYAATTLDVRQFGLAHETYVFRHWDHDATWQDVLAGRPGGMWLSIPTLHDPSVAPPGEHLVIFTSLMPYDAVPSWDEAKPRYTEMMVDEVERLLPGFRESLTFSDSATPATFADYTLASRGAIYGWANNPGQTVPKRLRHETPIAGLYLAGHWTDPGTGSVRCLLSGAQAAASITGHGDPVAFLASLVA